MLKSDHLQSWQCQLLRHSINFQCRKIICVCIVTADSIFVHVDVTQFFPQAFSAVRFPPLRRNRCYLLNGPGLSVYNSSISSQIFCLKTDTGEFY